MPSIAMPDPTRHKYCLRCKKWYEPKDGIPVPRAVPLLFAMFLLPPLAHFIVKKVKAMLSPESCLFMCNECYSSKRRRDNILWVIMVLFIVSIAVYLALI